MVVAECVSAEMDTTITDSKGCAVGGTNTEEGGLLTNGQSRGAGVTVEGNGCIGDGVGNGISSDDKAVSASGNGATDGARVMPFTSHEAHVLADHGKNKCRILLHFYDK